ncbi:MAG: TRAP transporter small permease subunit [Pseudomonadota bacterium]
MGEYLAKTIHRLSELSGRAVAWFVVAMIALTFYDVLMRYLFNNGSVALQELEWHLFGVIILIGAAYTLKHDNHVRVDLIYGSNKLSDRQRDWVDLLGTTFFLLPFCGLVIFNSIPFIEIAYIANEHSPDPGGLPYRWILKSTIPLGFALLALQGIANLVTLSQRIFRLHG